MHPILFKLPIPHFLESYLGGSFTIYSYGFFIVLGAISGVAYLTYNGKKVHSLSFDTINSLFLLLLVAAVVGGKFFLLFENPSYYAANLGALFTGSGFVFYGSLLFTIPVMLYFFKKHQLPVLAMLDLMAIITCIVHAFGRMGCFMAGCCHGKEWYGPFSVTFTNPASLAPLNTPLHPTQLYSISMILLILVILIFMKKYKRFDGQLFLSYLMLYAIGRSVIEIFRGDISRGYVIDGYLSNSQFISLLVFVISTYFYMKLRKQSKNIRQHKA